MRSQLCLDYQDRGGNAISGARLYVFAGGTGDVTHAIPTGSTASGSVYAASSGGVALGTDTGLLTDANGHVDLWFDTQQDVDVVYTDNNGTATYASPPHGFVTLSLPDKHTYTIGPAQNLLGQANAVVYQDAGGTYRGYYLSNGTMIPSPSVSSSDAAVVFNELFSLISKGVIAYSQDLTVLQPITLQPGCGIIGPGSDGKGSPTRQPTIFAGATFSPAPSLADGSLSRVITVPGAADNSLLINVAVDAVTYADSALGGTGTNLRVYGSSFWGGAYWSVVSNGGEWRFFNTDVRQRAAGQGAWRHLTASDFIYNGGFIEGSDGSHPTVNVTGGDGHVLSNLHIINQTGSGNTRLNCTNSSLANVYFDGQGDTNGGAVVSVSDTGNQLTGCRVKCGNGDGTGCRAVLLDATSIGHGCNLTVNGLQLWASDVPRPNLAYLIEVNDPNANPGQIILSNIMSHKARGTNQDVFSNAGLAAILTTAGNAPVRSLVAINEVFV